MKSDLELAIELLEQIEENGIDMDIELKLSLLKSYIESAHRTYEAN